MFPVQVIECHSYAPEIIALRKREAELIKRANSTNAHGTLIQIEVEYRHVNSKLHNTIRNQRYCYSTKKEQLKERVFMHEYFPKGWKHLRPKDTSVHFYKLQDFVLTPYISAYNTIRIYYL